MAEDVKAYTGEEKDFTSMIRELEADMKKAAEALEFEKAARIRDRIRELNRLNKM